MQQGLSRHQPRAPARFRTEPVKFCKPLNIPVKSYTFDEVSRDIIEYIMCISSPHAPFKSIEILSCPDHELHPYPFHFSIRYPCVPVCSDHAIWVAEKDRIA